MQHQVKEVDVGTEGKKRGTAKRHWGVWHDRTATRQSGRRNRRKMMGDPCIHTSHGIIGSTARAFISYSLIQIVMIRTGEINIHLSLQYKKTLVQALHGEGYMIQISWSVAT